VNKAVIANLTKDIPVSQTVNDCTDLREFQRIVKLSYKYDGAMLGDRPVPGKVFRVFAAKDVRRKRLYKIKNVSREKIPYTQKHSIIQNGDVKDKPVLEDLDRSWYIKLARQRVLDFEGEKDVSQ